MPVYTAKLKLSNDFAWINKYFLLKQQINWCLLAKKNKASINSTNACKFRHKFCTFSVKLFLFKLFKIRFYWRGKKIHKRGIFFEDISSIWIGIYRYEQQVLLIAQYCLNWIKSFFLKKNTKACLWAFKAFSRWAFKALMIYLNL